MPLQTEKPPLDSKSPHEKLRDLTPHWLEAKAAAERDGRMNARLNQQEHDAMVLVNRVLDQMIEIRLIEDSYGA